MVLAVTCRSVGELVANRATAVQLDLRNLQAVSIGCNHTQRMSGKKHIAAGVQSVCAKSQCSSAADNRVNDDQQARHDGIV